MPSTVTHNGGAAEFVRRCEGHRVADDRIARTIVHGCGNAYGRGCVDPCLKALVRGWNVSAQDDGETEGRTS